VLFYNEYPYVKVNTDYRKAAVTCFLAGGLYLLILIVCLVLIKKRRQATSYRAELIEMQPFPNPNIERIDQDSDSSLD